APTVRRCCARMGNQGSTGGDPRALPALRAEVITLLRQLLCFSSTSPPVLSPYTDCNMSPQPPDGAKTIPLAIVGGWVLQHTGAAEREGRSALRLLRLASFGPSPAQEGGNVSFPMNDGDDFNRPARGPVDDQVVAKRPKKNRQPSEIFPFVTHTGVLCESLKGVEELRRHAVCGIEAIRRDVAPEIIQVLLGIAPKNVVTHARCFRRPSDFRRRRARTSVGSTRSPRSREARRRPSSWLNSVSCSTRAFSWSSSRRSASRTTSLAE